MKSLLVIILITILLAGCAASEDAQVFADIPGEETLFASTPAEHVTTETAAPTIPEIIDPIHAMIDQMSLEERVGQLFLARCDAVTAASHASDYHLGGFVLFGVDFEYQTPESVREAIAAYQNSAVIPLLIAVDEEGGTVNRVSRYSAFREIPFPSPRSLYDQGGMELLLNTEAEKCILLRSLGINVNLGPVCDITTTPGAFMYSRSLGLDAQTTAGCIREMVHVMDCYGIGSVLKHFPGYGNNSDTHTGIAVDSRELAELEQSDLIPFAAGMDAGCGAILVSHTIVQALDKDLPASLSPGVHNYLRDTMGFDGVILTDDLVMQAVTDLYGAGEAAVMAVQAGNDLLCSTDYVTQYEAVLAAVVDGRIDMDTLNNAVTRVLKWKLDLGLIE